MTETGWKVGAPRALSLPHTVPLPPSSHCREAERASNLAPIRSRPSPGSPAGRPARCGPSWRNFAQLGVQAWSGKVLPLLPSAPLPLPPPLRPRPGASSGDRTSPGRALCICKPEPRLPRAALPGRGCGCGGAAVGAAVLAGAGHCHAPAARRSAESRSRYISAGKGTLGGAEDEGARAWAPTDCQPLPSPRPARSPRPPRTRLRRSSSWSSYRGGSCGGGDGARRPSA